MPEPHNIPDISHLTAKQQNFVHAMAEGQDTVEAYRTAGYSQNSSVAEQRVKAFKLKRNTYIAPILTAIQLRKADLLDMSVETHVRELSELANDAKGLQQYGAAIRAVELKGKVAGHYVERVRIEETPRVENALAFIAELLGDDLAAQAAAKLGIEWLPARDTAVHELEHIEVTDDVSEAE
jgi:hypothetical protein